MPWDMWCCLVFVLLFMVTLLLTVILTVVYILRYKVTDSFYSIRAATLKKTTQCQTAPLSTRQSVEKELNQYLRTLEAPHKQTLWIGGSSMRHISHYWLSWLKKYLCIPATSAPSEQAFSTSGNTVICQRSALKPERVDQLVFLALNL